jgi:WD40 repeat protein
MSSKDTFGVALSPDGTQVVGGGGNGNPSPTLWDIQTGKVIQKFNGIFAFDITYSSDGKYIAGVGFDGVVNIWDANSGSLVRAFTNIQMDNGIGGIAYSPDGRIIAASGAGDNYTGMVALWDVATGQLLTKFRSSNRYQTLALLFSNDGKRLFAGGRDGVIRVYGVIP